MQKATSFDELQKLTASKFETLNLEFEAISQNFSLIPLTENTKQQLVLKGLKNKAGWYACLVNNNIDILLLPDYFENYQTRNILLKKETEQFQAEYDKFNELKSIESNTALYENFFNEIKPQTVSFDLFSTQIVKKDECPLTIKKIFENWHKHPKSNVLQNIILEFYEWHTLDNFSFSGNRQILIWLNYKLWLYFGNVAMLFNLEHFFYNNWNKENREGCNSIYQLIDFIKSQIEKIKAELKALYRSQISYNQLNAIQKIANNYVFNLNFNLKLNTDKNEASQYLAKTLALKGFINIEDLPNQTLTEKQILCLQQWVEDKTIAVNFDEEEWVAYINPSNKAPFRLAAYNNLTIEKPLLKWESIAAIKPKLKIQIEEVLPTIEAPILVLKIDTSARKPKAFFG